MRRALRRPTAAASIAAALALASPARAQNTDTPVEVRTCDASDAMVSAMRVELAATSTPIAKVTVVCLAGARVLVAVFPKGAARPAAREVDVADVAPDARTRSVAIATGELLRSIGSEPVAVAPAPAPAAPAPVPAPPPAQPPLPIVVQITPPPTAPAPRSPQRDEVPVAWSLGGALHARVFPMASTALIGPALELDAGLGKLPLRLHIASDLGVARDTLPAGDASLVAWTGSAALLIRARASAVFFDAGPFIEGGGAFAEGSEPTGNGVLLSGSSPLALVGGEGVIGARLHGGVVPYVAIDAGGVLAGIEADVDDRAALGMHGLFVGARVGVAIAP